MLAGMTEAGLLSVEFEHRVVVRDDEIGETLPHPVAVEVSADEGRKPRPPAGAAPDHRGIRLARLQHRVEIGHRLQVAVRHHRDRDGA